MTSTEERLTECQNAINQLSQNIAFLNSLIESHKDHPCCPVLKTALYQNKDEFDSKVALFKELHENLQQNNPFPTAPKVQKEEEVFVWELNIFPVNAENLPFALVIKMLMGSLALATSKNKAISFDDAQTIVFQQEPTLIVATKQEIEIL